MSFQETNENESAFQDSIHGIVEARRYGAKHSPKTERQRSQKDGERETPDPDDTPI